MSVEIDLVMQRKGRHQCSCEWTTTAIKHTGRAAAKCSSSNRSFTPDTRVSLLLQRCSMIPSAAYFSLHNCPQMKVRGVCGASRPGPGSPAYLNTSSGAAHPDWKAAWKSGVPMSPHPIPAGSGEKTVWNSMNIPMNVIICIKKD